MTALPFVAPAGALFLALFLAGEGRREPSPSRPAPQDPRVVSPVRIALDERLGLLVVTDSRAREVQVFDSAMRLVSAFPIEGKPLGVAAGGRTILVGNATTGEVEIYDHSGLRLGELAGTFSRPNDIALDVKKRLVFVADSVAREIRIVRQQRGRKPSRYPPRIPVDGPDPTLLAAPTTVAIDPRAEEVFVSDFGDPSLGIDPRVQIFGYDGVLRRTISSRFGMVGRRFSRPQGLAVEGDRIFVIDSWLSRVLIFDRATLAQLGWLGTFGTDPGELSLPLDLVVEPSTKDVYVTNNLNRRIELFAGGAR